MKCYVMFLLALLMMALTGCEDTGKERAKFEDNAIKSVQLSDSLMPGTSCKNFIGSTLTALEARNNYIKIKGWQAYKEPGHTVVRFVVERNEKPLEWKWYIENGMVIPINELSQGIMVRQKAKYLES